MASLQKPISIEYLIINGCKVQTDLTTFMLLESPESAQWFISQYPDVDSVTNPAVYAHYLYTLSGDEITLVLWVMLPSQEALDVFNAWCSTHSVFPTYWAGAKPSGDWKGIQEHDFESERVVQLAWNRLQEQQKAKI